MIRRNAAILVISFSLIITASTARFDPVRAHCDTMDGPVIIDAKKALETGNVNLVLVWVRSADEGEIRKAFSSAIEGRKSASGKEASDRAFFETLVRVHRAGEGAGYGGLKPAGSGLNPAVKAADRAIADGKIQPVIDLLSKNLSEKVKERFGEAIEKKNYDPNNVPAGRDFVKAYVEYVHFVEAVHTVINHAGGHHEAEGHGHAAGHGGHEAHLLHILFALIGLAIGAGIMFLIMRRSRRA